MTKTSQPAALLIDGSARGRLELSGRDRVALLQRLSTNDLLPLEAGQGAETVLTNFHGRILDLVSVLLLEEHLLLLTGPGRGAEIAGYLRSNIFFMDQVKLSDVSAEWGQLELYGAAASRLLEQVSGQSLEQLPLFGHTLVSIGGQEVRLVRLRPLAGACWAALLPQTQLPALQQQLLEAGAQLLDQAGYELLRVEAGQPGPPELNLEYIPLEANLWDVVSFKKGCYVGQEIIARMESRGRLAKRLQGLRLSALPDSLPAELRAADGKEAGTLTSAAQSPALGAIGLAFVRTAYAEPGTTLTVAGQPATVVQLPFEL